VLELVVSDYIYNHFNFDAGVSSKLRASLVSKGYLYDISISLGLKDLVLKSKSLSQLSKKNTTDLFESLLGAVYLDGGLDKAKNVIFKYVIIDDDNISFVLKNSIDFKTNFQELMQKEAKKFEYKILSSKGLDHEKVFEIGLYIEGELIDKSTGGSIREAEEKLAENYIRNNVK